MASKMASLWQILGRGSSSSPSVAEFLRLSNANIQRVSTLTSRECVAEEHLNPSQCRSMSSKLVRTLENIAGLFYLWGIESSSSTSNTSTLPAVVLENFYLVSERAKELVESCCSADWCQASTFQIQNEEAFKEILLETSLCYNSIFELVKDKVPYQDLRCTSTFEPPTSAEVVQDRMALLERVQNFVNITDTADSVLIRKQHLAKHLLRRLRSITSQSNIEDFDVCHLSLWPDGKSPDDEWGNSDFLGSNVYKTTWLDVPCAKKVFELGVQEAEILAEARILARLNHPNIVKFICCGKDSKRKCRHFIAMEQMEEGLHDVISQQAQDKNGAPFPLRSAVDIMLQIAYGTCYLHENGIAHRDLKTSNVVVSQITTPHLKDYLQVKVVDFGLSKVKLSASRSNTISRPKIGTTVYMAPEAFVHGRANWFKADVYSFGIMCAVILSGEEPFQEIQRKKLYEAICNGVRPMLPQETPEELARLIRKCWDTDRNVRPDFVEICTELAKLRHKLLREDAHGHGFKDDWDGFASSYIQDMIKKQSEARKQDCSHAQSQLLENVIEDDEWFVPEQEFDIQKQHDFKPLSTVSSLDNKDKTIIEEKHENLPRAQNGSGSTTNMDKDFIKSNVDASQTETAVDIKQVWETEGSSEERLKLGHFKRELQELLTVYTWGIKLSAFPKCYRERYSRPLDPKSFGANSVKDLFQKVEDVAVVKYRTVIEKSTNVTQEYVLAVDKPHIGVEAEIS